MTEPRHILVTGSTGALGSTVTRLLLTQQPHSSLTLLLRASSTEHLHQRALELGRFWNLDIAGLTRAGRLQFLAGDVTQPRLGIDAAAYDQLTHTVTHLLHLAGDVRLNHSLEQARLHAVGSMQHVLAFCEAGRTAGTFTKLEYASTVGVAGRHTGLVPETPLTGPRTYHNTYEQAKAEAEALLLQAMDRGLQATIHRPSMIVGDSATGQIIHFQIFYHLCEWLAGRKTGGWLPALGDWKLDVVPVDYVARAIVLSMDHPDFAGRILHLCSGPQHARRLADLSQQVRQIMTRRGLKLPALKQVPRPLLRALIPLVSPLVGEKPRKALRSLPPLLDYLEDCPGFGNTHTCALLQQHSLALPDPELFIPRVLEHYLSCKHPSPATPRE